MSRYLSPHPAPCQSEFPGDKTVASFHLGGTEAWSTLPKVKGEVCPRGLVASHMQWSGSAFLFVYMQVWRRLSLFSLPPLCECSITLLHSHGSSYPTSPQGGYTQIKGESKEPGRGQAGTSNVTGQLCPLLQTFFLGAALQAHCQPPGEVGEIKGMAGSL